MTNITEDKHLVNDEINDHKVELNQWVEKVKDLPVPANRQKVCERFMRDCQTLLTDLDGANPPSCADLCDFDDRRRSLEVQFHNITQDSE